MAKKSMINREKKREKTVQKFAAKRAVLKAQIKDLNLSDDERWAAQVKFQKLPRNASPTRQVRRCVLNRSTPCGLPPIWFGSAEVA